MNEEIINSFTKENDKLNLDINNLNATCITSKDNNFELDSEGNLTVKSIIAENIQITAASILNVIYPVGSIYMSVNDINPSTIFKGEWEQIKDRFLLSAGDNHKNEEIVGEEAHQLVIDELPNHNHGNIYVTGIPLTINSTGGSGAINLQTGAGGARPQENPLYTGGIGKNIAHNNMPPYLTVYIWKRVK